MYEPGTGASIAFACPIERNLGGALKFEPLVFACYLLIELASTSSQIEIHLRAQARSQAHNLFAPPVPSAE